MRNRKISLFVAVLVLVMGLLFSGCGAKEEKKETKVKKETTTKQAETTETPTEEQTPQVKVRTDLDAAQKDVSETLSEIETDIKDIQNIDTGQDNESGY